METFSDKAEDITYFIENKGYSFIKLKIEDFCGNFHRTMVHIQIKLECNCKEKWRHFPVKQDFPLTYVW